MIKYNANPKGWKTDDCVIRAIAPATNKLNEIQDWLDGYRYIDIADDMEEDWDEE